KAGKPVFGLLKVLSEHPALSAECDRSPAAERPTSVRIADVNKVLASMIPAVVTDDLMEAIQRVAPDAALHEVAAVERPDGVADSFDLAFGDAAPFFREVLVQPHDEQRQTLKGLKLSLLAADEIDHDEPRRQLKSLPVAIAYGGISSSSSRQHVKHVGVA